MKRALQFLAMAGLLLVIAFACQREENELLQNEKGISLQEAKQFFEKNIQGLLSGFIPNWKTYKEWNNEEVAYVYASNPVADAHILFVKNKGRLDFNGFVLQGDDIFNINVNEETKVNRKNPHHYTEEEKQILAKMTYLGQAIYCDMCGDPVKRYSPSEYIKKRRKRIAKNSPYKEQCEDCEKTIQLTEVVVNGNLKKGKSISEIIQIVRDLRDIGIFKAPPQMGTLKLIFESMRYSSSPASPTPPPAVNPREIFPHLDKYPCAGELVKQLPSLNNDIAKLVQQTFQDRMGKKEQYDIAFFADETMSENLDGLCEMKYKSKGGDTLRFEITLNGKMLKTATKEYILGTMYHEVLHAYLDVERERLGKTKFENKYPNVYIHYMTGMYKGKAYSKTQFLLDNPIKTDNHHFKFANFISKIADAIDSYNPKISREIAYAIARTGIVRHSEMFIWEQRLNQNEREGNSESQGTKCN